MTIKEKIYGYFTNRPSLKVLFVFDPMDGGIRSEIEADDTPWPSDYIYHIFEGDWFGTKIRLTEEWHDKKVVLVFTDRTEPNPADQNTCVNFPLMSILVANMVFHEEDAIAFMQQRGIPMQFKKFFERHISELLREKTDKVMAPYYSKESFSFDVAYRGLLSIYLGRSQMMEWYQIIAQLIIVCATDSKKAQIFFNKISGRSSKGGTKDVYNALNDKLVDLFGVTYDENTEEKMCGVVEVLKYNAITQLLAVDDRDPYKLLKIESSVKLQMLNTMLQQIKENLKLDKQFEPAFRKLGCRIKEDVLIDVYGTEAEYAYLSEEMCRPIITNLIDQYLYSDPNKVCKQLSALLANNAILENIRLLINFYNWMAKYYLCVSQIETIRLNTPDLYVENYIQKFYFLDMYYRKAVDAFCKLDMSEVSAKTESFKKNLDIAYAEITNDINLEWIKCVKEKGDGFSSMTTIQRQSNFYKDNIEACNTKVAVIVSDALRYEIAAELKQQLMGKKHIVTLTPSLAVLPTETKYGKPSLLPHETLECTGDNMMVDGKILSSLPLRTAQLQKYEEKSICIDFKALNGMTRNEKREVFKNHVTYVFHNTIDENGHGCTARSFTTACNVAIDEIAQLIPFIHDTCNVADVYVTSDHGFLYNDMPFEEKDKFVVTEETVEKKSRYFISEDQTQQIGITKFGLGEVSAIKGDYFVGVPTGTNRLAAPAGDYEFTHGGASLQELIIPILHSKYQRENGKQQVNVDLMERTLKVVSSRLKAHVIQREAVSMSLQERKVVCGVYVNDEPVSAIKTFTLDSADEELTASRVHEINLTVTDSASAKIMQFKVFDENDLLNPLIVANVINDTLIERDDFGI